MNKTQIFLKIRRSYGNIFILILFTLLAGATSFMLFFQSSNRMLFDGQLVSAGYTAEQLIAYDNIYSQSENVIGIIACAAVVIGLLGGIVLLSFRNRNIEDALMIMHIHGMGKKDVLKKASLDLIFLALPCTFLGCLMGYLMFHHYVVKIGIGTGFDSYGFLVIDAIKTFIIVWILVAGILFLGNIYSDYGMLEQSAGEYLHGREKEKRNNSSRKILLVGGTIFLLYPILIFHIKVKHLIIIGVIAICLGALLLCFFYIVFGVYMKRKRHKIKIQKATDLCLCFLCERNRRNAFLAIVISFSTIILCLMANIIFNISEVLRTAYYENMGYTCVTFIKDYDCKDEIKNILDENDFTYTYGYSKLGDYSDINAVSGMDGKYWALVIEEQTDNNIHFSVPKGTFIAEKYFANRCGLKVGSDYSLFGGSLKYTGLIPEKQYMSLISYNFVVNRVDYRLPIDNSYKPVFIMNLTVDEENHLKKLLNRYDVSVDSASEFVDQIKRALADYFEIIAVVFSMIFLVTVMIFYTMISADLEKRREEMLLYHIYGASDITARRIVFYEYIMVALISSISVSGTIAIFGEIFFYATLGIHFNPSISILLITVGVALIFVLLCCKVCVLRITRTTGMEVLRDE